LGGNNGTSVLSQKVAVKADFNKTLARVGGEGMHSSCEPSTRLMTATPTQSYSIKKYQIYGTSDIEEFAKSQKTYRRRS